VAAAALSALLLIAFSAAAGPPAETTGPDFLLERGPKAQILYLGVFHFDYPGLDVHQSAHQVDVMAPQRQREIAELVELLARYRPTRIAVEATPDRQPFLDSLYREFHAGRWDPARNEIYQLGFRLARRLGHAKVYAVDAERHPFFVDLAREQLEPRAEELFATDREWRERFDRWRSYEDSTAAERGETLRRMFLQMNSPLQINRAHLSYSVGFFKFDGEEGGYLGADFVSGWYNRNLRIFRNLQRITESPGDRILFLVGSGHLPLLHFITQHSPEYDLVEVADYLGQE